MPVLGNRHRRRIRELSFALPRPTETRSLSTAAASASGGLLGRVTCNPSPGYSTLPRLQIPSPRRTDARRQEDPQIQPDDR